MIFIDVKKNEIVGKIKPMHCVNNFPSMGSAYNESFAALKIPYSRLHDTAILNPHLVDIPSVFPNFDADENDENSYDFAFTDFFIKRLHDMGVETFYRLGVTIENYAKIKAYHVKPPKDFAKWARICEHIILHYNYGWANGFRFGLKYWEIWNEPDNEPNYKVSQTWQGTFEEFLKFYEIVSNHLKNNFPELKIGGYASCGFYAILGRKATEQANVSARSEYFVKCFVHFLEYISSKEHKSPLDFFSWHSYGNVEQNPEYARYCRETLDKYGFKETESILNEWNPSKYMRGSLIDSSNVLANMLALQNSPLDMLMYYDFKENSSFCGAFNPINKSMFKTYYVFKAFSTLYELKNCVKCDTELSPEVFAVAAFDGSNGALVITNNSKQVNEFTITGIKIKDFYLLSKEKDLEIVKYGEIFSLKPFESVMIKFI